jgi:hypothetical protein
MSLFPHDEQNLAIGRARVLYAAIDDVAVPTSLDDVIHLEGPGYAPKTGYHDFGAAKSSASYTKGLSEQKIEIQQVDAAVFTDITETNRSIKFSIAEIKPENLLILEQAADIETVVAGPGRSAQKRVPFGAISDLSLYRIILIAQRKRASGVVTEAASGIKRGRLIGITLNRCSLSTTDTAIEFDKGNLAEAPVTMDTFPEPGMDEGEEFGGSPRTPAPSPRASAAAAAQAAAPKPRAAC